MEYRDIIENFITSLSHNGPHFYNDIYSKKPYAMLMGNPKYCTQHIQTINRI